MQEKVIVNKLLSFLVIEFDIAAALNEALWEVIK